MYIIPSLTKKKSVLKLTQVCKFHCETQLHKTPCTNELRSAAFCVENYIYFFTKQATLLRRPTVLILPFQLVLTDLTFLKTFTRRQSSLPDLAFILVQGILNEREGSVQLTSPLKQDAV
jgi:hypothetical protein